MFYSKFYKHDIICDCKTDIYFKPLKFKQDMSDEQYIYTFPRPHYIQISCYKVYIYIHITNHNVV